MPLLTQNALLAIAEEAAEGAAETLAAADAIMICNARFNPTQDRHERCGLRGNLSPINKVSGKRSATLSFSVELKGSGTAGMAPEWGICLEGCKMKATPAAGVSVTYTPISTGDKSYTLALYEDGVCYKIWGARGSFSLDLKTGEAGMANFVFTGADYSVTDVALLSGMTYDATVPPAVLDASLTIHGYSAVVNALTIDMGNQVTLRTSISAESGNLSTFISKRAPGGSLDPEMVLVATEDFFGDWRAGTEGALSAVLGATAGNIITISASKAAYKDLSPSERDGIRTLSLPFDLNGSTGDDELSIAFT